MGDPLQSDPVLNVRNLSVSFGKGEGKLQALDGVSLSVGRGEIRALVGESGCGKSVTMMAILGLLPLKSASIEADSIHLGDTDLRSARPSLLRSIRGRRIGMIFQDPMTSLTPVHTVGYQIGEGLRQHFKMSRNEARSRALDLMDLVRIPAPRSRLNAYPHELSGGMRQRVMIAMALACNPELLIADEPTTALDVTVQAQILNLISDLRDELGMSVVLITHDLGVVAAAADSVSVMYAGRIVEEAPVHEIFRNPTHGYTAGLLHEKPPDRRGLGMNTATPLIEVRQVSRSFPVGRTLLGKPRNTVRALDGIDLELRRGETLGLVGESGCGKSTLARLLVALDQPSSGDVVFEGHCLNRLSRRKLRKERKRIQMIFQDPLASLNPRMTVRASIAEPLGNFLPQAGVDADDLVDDLALQVGLSLHHLDRFPHELSGGQCQRVGIARAIVSSPDVIVADEPVSALDVSIQAQILNLLFDIKDRMGLSMIFVSHDLSVV
ncbi:UNVERIFIED_CONTAM: hypothetical protein GTU68_005901, partial [Idotea baltica]|nr:hypothetical protein [Idotea baltica]